MFLCIVLTSCVVALITGVSARPNGAPSSACSTITPSHGGAVSQPIPGGFYLYSDLIDSGGTYTASQAYEIRLESALNEQFQGFLIQARQSGTTVPIGSFSNPLPSGTQTLRCSGVLSATVTHTDESLKSSVQFTWTAPSTAGTVEFRYAVVVQFNTFYADINAGSHRPPIVMSTAISSSMDISPSIPATSLTLSSSVLQSSTQMSSIPTQLSSSSPATAIDTSSVLGLSSLTGITSSSVIAISSISPTVSFLLSPSLSLQPSSLDDTIATSAPVTTAPAATSMITSIPIHSSSLIFQPSNTPSPACPDTSYTPSSSFPIIFRSPAGCTRESCSFYWAMGPNIDNSQYLDVYMEGTAAGWMAVGFSDDQQMANSDVLGCRVDDASTVTVVDSWNPTPNYTPNQLDGTQLGLCTHSASYINGRLSCLFSRSVAVTDIEQDLDLNNTLWIIRGYRLEGQSGATNLQYHSATPLFSTQRYNPLVDTNNAITSSSTVDISEAMSTSISQLTSMTTVTVMPTSTPSLSCPNTDKTPLSSFPIIFRSPAGCTRESCSFYWAMGPNSDNSQYLDVYMEGTAAGWMAMGFSDDQQMANTDVLGCRVNTNSTVSVVDSWNGSPNYSPNMLDATQEGICTYSTSYINGRISCLFSRSASVTDIGHDLNLNSDLWIIQGYRTTSQHDGSIFLNYHSSTPQFSSQRYNPLTDSNQRCPLTDKTAFSSFPLVFRIPSNCERTNCTFYWAMGPNSINSQYLDVYMEGTAAGWMAVGFSQDQLMSNTDVLGCVLNSNSNIVTVVDSWNPSRFRSPNEFDNTQDAVCAQRTSYSNGRLSCLFSRSSGITNPGQDYYLDASLWIITGYRLTANTANTGLSYHTAGTPAVSGRKYNPFNDTNQAATTHGVVCPTFTAPGSNDDYPVQVRSPGGDYFFAARFNNENSSFIDIKLEGIADGWVAVGFTKTRTMYESDVFACQRASDSDTVSVIDTWNPSGSRSNILDDNQIGMCPHRTEYSNGRIQCIFSRYIGVINIGRDFDLNDTLYRIYDARSTSRGSSLGAHDYGIPSFSSAQANLLTDIINGSIEEVESWPKPELIKTHGIFMIISWILLATSGAFFAAWMKPVLPNGEWFQVHRALMIASLVVGAIGFIFAFVAHAKGTETAGIINFSPDGKNTVHFVFGLTIMCLHIANPLIAIFRCKPTGNKRWIFNLGHAHIIGYGALVLALINIAIGTHLMDRGSYKITGFYIASLLLLVAYHVTLFVIHTINAFKAPEEDRPALVPSLLKYKYLLNLVFEKESEDILMTSIDGEDDTEDDEEQNVIQYEDSPATAEVIEQSVDHGEAKHSDSADSDEHQNTSDDEKDSDIDNGLNVTSHEKGSDTDEERNTSDEKDLDSDQTSDEKDSDLHEEQKLTSDENDSDSTDTDENEPPDIEINKELALQKNELESTESKEELNLTSNENNPESAEFDEERKMMMTNDEIDPESDHDLKKKKPLKAALTSFSWVATGVHLVAVTVAVIVLIGLIGAI